MTMSTTMTPAARPPMTAGGTTFANVLRSEWIKLWSLRSTMWTLIATVTVTLTFTTLIAWGNTVSLGKPDGPDRASFDPTNTSLAGIAFGQLAIAVLGALVLSAEYTTGGIRTTFTAVPQRMRVVLAKAVSFGVVALVTGLVTCFVAFFIGQVFFATKHAEAHLGDPHVLRAVIGGGLYIAGSGMFGFALGALLRKTAAAVTAAAALLFVLPLLSNLLRLLPGTIGRHIAEYFTANAGGHITDVMHQDGPSPWVGYSAFTLEWLAILALGVWLIRRRDA
jgi:ABC-type transport system involved in multi-copper enzyme maturation permease subunit